MVPTIQPGDLVIYKPIKSDFYPKEGAIVVAKDPLSPKTLIVKRIYKDTNQGFELRGDNYMHSIDSRKYGLVRPGNLCGVVEQIISFNSKKRKAAN